MGNFARTLLVDLAALVSMVSAIATGFVLWRAVPGGVGRRCRQQFLEATRLQWIDAHAVTGTIVLAMVVAHLLTHRSSVKRVRRMLRRR
jgi:uncharacterized iron-regulated membrane protein